MKITIVGTGYVGLVTGVCLAEIGHDVFCLDVDQRKVDILNQGGIPIHEPGLLEMITRMRVAKRITFSTDVQASVAHGDIQFIAVGTPPDEDGSADLQYVLAAAQNIARYMQGFKVIVDKSTVPVGTAQRVEQVVQEILQQRGVAYPFSVVSNPEFLKEGAAVDDFMHPDRIILGCHDDEMGCRAKEEMTKLYAPFNRDRELNIFMDVRSAEFAKYAANAMLATRISFMNELANLSELIGTDIDAVRRGIGSDPRIGYHFLYAGAGYGGSCFPKDVQALLRIASEAGLPLKILDAVEAVNEQQKNVLLAKIQAQFGDDLSGRTFALWGLSFKPNTDDMREASSRRLIVGLLKKGAKIVAYDPVAQQEAQRVLALDFHDQEEMLQQISYVQEAYQALKAADALIIMTEWEEFRCPDFEMMQSLLKTPLIFDGRNLYDLALMQKMGFHYECIGRPDVLPVI